MSVLLTPDFAMKLALASASFLLGYVQLCDCRLLQRRAPLGNKDVIIQMFEWSWDSIAAECTSFIGPAGYGYVQASPAQEHITGDQWWTDYQPVSYILSSKRGNRAQYKNMIETCRAAGVGVIADTIWNHMTGVGSGVGVAGSTFTHYGYPGIYEDDNFHHCGLEPNDTIVNYDNRLEVQTCQLDGLADLATETEQVRATLAAYANDLISLGVSGLRLDAAKHMAATDVANMTSRLVGSPYITQEVIWGAGEPIQPSEYIGIGDVMEFRYTTALLNSFLGSDSNNISGLQNLEDKGWVPGDLANVFVADHDTERNEGSLNADSPSNTYLLAHIFALAHPYGTPTVLSSYVGFTDSDLGAPDANAGTCSGNGGMNGWICQHRWNAIVGMVGFRNEINAAASTVKNNGASPRSREVTFESEAETASPINNWASASPQQIAFGRGSSGFVAINNADFTWAGNFTTSMPEGSYCDVISGTSANGICSGFSFSISASGLLKAVVPARTAIAIHTGALGTGGIPDTTVAVTFEETATTTFGENIFLVGSIPQLGSWDPTRAVGLSPTNYPTWVVTVGLPADATFEYKFIRKEPDGSVVWESDPNRNETSDSSGSQTIVTTWR